MSKSLFLFATLMASACSSLKPMPPSAHVVAAPISKRANVVLRHCVKDFSSADGRWDRSMSPGCAQIWATQFGYRAGVRRERDDVIALGRATARRISREVRRRDIEPDDPALFGFPALLVSGALGGRRIDAMVISRGLDRLDDIGDPGPRASAGIAVLLAEAAQLDPHQRDERLAQARTFAAQADDGDPTWTFLAWAAIARASSADEDIRRARAAETRAAYAFDTETGAFQPPEPAREILSAHLSMVHGYADLAQATGGEQDQKRAVAVLDYVFGDAYFDGRLLVHDRFGGTRSEQVCSGCNLMALYLVDRLRGDSFVIRPVPNLPRRDWPEQRQSSGWDSTLLLRAGAGVQDYDLVAIPNRGRILAKHEKQDAEVRFEYRVLAYEEQPPYGGIRLEVRTHGRDAKHTDNTYTIPLAFDEQGVARASHWYGFEPLVWHVVFTRDDRRAMAAVFRLRETPTTEPPAR